MASRLNHSPADIVRRLLIAKNYGVDPSSRPWPIFVASEPPAPDNAITIYDTLGRDDGREMVEGETMKHHGIQMRLRATTHKIGYMKARAVAVGMDKSVYQDTIILDDSEYLIQCINRTSNVLSLGKRVPTDKHNLFTINAVAVIRLVATLVDMEYWPDRYYPDPYFVESFYPRGPA